ncbi:MAG: hypothetical protein IJ039_07230 [Clostridia bacterium]|nr:hypothetical protein [Clostridia bacterium]
MRLGRLLSIILLLAVCLSCFASCNPFKKSEGLTDEELITRRVNTFLTAYNDGDMDAVFDCLDAKTGNKFKALFNVVGGIAGGLLGIDIDLTDLFSLGVGVVDGDYMRLQINDINIVDESNAIVTATMDLQHSQTATIYFIMVYEKDDWYIHDMTDKKMGGNSGSSVPIWTWNGNFENGLTEITFTKDGAQYQGVVNSEGKIIYSVRKTEQEDYIFIGNDTILVVGINSYTEELCPVKLVNGNGETVEMWDVSLYDKILGYGDGMFMTYRAKSTIDGIKHIYEIIDCGGNSVQGEICLETGFYSEYSKYVGDGVFAICTNAYYGGEKEYAFINSVSGQRFMVTGWKSVEPTVFINGKMFVQQNCKIYDGLTLMGDKKTASTFVLGSDGTVTDIDLSEEDVIWHENGYVAYSNNDKTYIIDICSLDKEPVIYDTYSSSMVERVMMNGNHGALALRGKDGRIYVTVIDANGEQLIDPIATGTETWDESCVSYSEGVLVYKNEKDKICILNEEGKETVTEFSYIGEFEGGEAIAETVQNGESSYCFINKNGEIIKPILTVEK